MTPTPIHSWKLPGVPDGFDVSIKREDMIGSTLSGNKVKCVCIEGMSNLTIFFLLDTSLADQTLYPICGPDPLPYMKRKKGSGQVHVCVWSCTVSTSVIVQSIYGKKTPNPQKIATKGFLMVFSPIQLKI